MHPTPVAVWLLRAGWVSLPLTVGPTVAAGLDGRSAPVAWVLAVTAWAAFAAVLLALLAPRPAGLVVVRVGAPAAAVVVAVVGEDASWAGVPALLALASLLPEVGRWSVNGSSYGDESRHVLRPPGPLLLGPIPLAGCALAGAVLAGPLLLAARQWVAGAVAFALGVPVARVAWRALAALTERWLVFVPAGLVLKDHTALLDPCLFRRRQVASLAPAAADTAAVDLTGGAFGLALELRVREPVAPALLATGAQTPVTALLLTPTRPGAVLADAAARRYPTA